MPSSPDDDPATMTGPSYRLTGVANRGLTGRRVAQAPSAPAGPTKGLLDKASSELETASRETPPGLKAARQTADDMVAELIPHFKMAFGKWQPRNLRPVPVKVVPHDAFNVELESLKQALRDQERDLLTTFRPKLVEDLRSGKGRATPTATVPVTPVTPQTKLTADEKAILWTMTGRSRGIPGAFFSSALGGIVVRADQVAVETIAHEMCHAFAHPQWDNFYIATSMQKDKLREMMFDVDEGIVSALAQMVLNSWFKAKPTKGGQRPATVPNGRVGYLEDIGTRAIVWIATIDKNPSGIPGVNTLRSYFHGDISFVLDEEAPLTSDVKCGGDQVRKLNDLL